MFEQLFDFSLQVKVFRLKPRNHGQKQLNLCLYLAISSEYPGKKGCSCINLKENNVVVGFFFLKKKNNANDVIMLLAHKKRKYK